MLTAMRLDAWILFQWDLHFIDQILVYLVTMFWFTCVHRGHNWRVLLAKTKPQMRLFLFYPATHWQGGLWRAIDSQPDTTWRYISDTSRNYSSNKATVASCCQLLAQVVPQEHTHLACWWAATGNCCSGLLGVGFSHSFNLFKANYIRQKEDTENKEFGSLSGVEVQGTHTECLY